MPLYYFSTIHGERHDDRDDPLDLPDDQAAWSQATTACGELLKELDGNLKPNREWRLDVRDERRELVFSLKLMPEAYR